MLDNAGICYLLVFPDPAEERAVPAEGITGLKDAPYFQPVDVRVLNLGQEQLVVDGVPVAILSQRFDDRVRVVEAHFSLPQVLSAASLQQRDRIRSLVLQKLLPAQVHASGLFEEYIILCTPTSDPTPDGFVDGNARELARFIRSQREVLDQPEMDEILAARVHYSRNDLTLVDWEGAVIVAPEGNYQSDIELFKIGNYQLLRYRMLDRSIEEDLSRINRQFHADRRRLLFGPTRFSLRRIISHRLELMIDFERTDQNLLLIGDWYSAKLYHVIQDQFYLDHWKATVKAKLDNLESIIHTIQENFSVSWSGFLEAVQLAGWIILLIGYFILFFVENHAVK
jgi:hypothetical protein